MVVGVAGPRTKNLGRHDPSVDVAQRYGTFHQVLQATDAFDLARCGKCIPRS